MRELLSKLRQWFGIDFELFDSNAGEWVHTTAELSGGDSFVRGQLCRAAALRTGARFIEDENPLLVLAIPLRLADRRMVAVGTFVTHSVVEGESLVRAAKKLGLDANAAKQWFARQVAWNPETLANIGNLACERLSVGERLKTLEREIRSVSLHLSTTYEEIGLLYRLTQNLKLTSRSEDLGDLALEWLAEVLPVESLAIQLVRPLRSDAVERGAAASPELLTYGPCPLDAENIERLVDRLRLAPAGRPAVVGRPKTSAEDWPWPEVHDLVIAPIADGEKGFGWLAAFNHSQGGGFGTPEASLLSSVGTILGIHGGNTSLYQQTARVFRWRCRRADLRDRREGSLHVRPQRSGRPRGGATRDSNSDSTASKSIRSILPACFTTSARSESTKACCANRAS